MIQAIGEPTVLAVRGFEEHYRMPGGHLRRRVADRVAIPAHHDGKRHRRLAKLERGAEVFAAWCLILGVAARCPRPGVLVDEQGEALTAEDLADMTGFPADLFAVGIEALLDERIGWLVRVPLGSALIREADHASESGGGESPKLDFGASGAPSVIGKDFSGGNSSRKDPVAKDAIAEDAVRMDAGPNAEATDSFRHAASECESPPFMNDRSDDREEPDDIDTPQDTESPQSTPAPDAPPARRTNRMPPIPNFGVVEPRPDAETQRIDDIEEALFHLSLLGRVSPDLYKSKNVTRHVIFDLWLQIDADKRILDTREAFVEQFKKLVLGDQDECKLAVRSF